MRLIATMILVAAGANIVTGKTGGEPARSVEISDAEMICEGNRRDARQQGHRAPDGSGYTLRRGLERRST
jgi:hypothetical protein